MEGMVGNIVQVTYYTLHSYTERKTARENCFLIRMLKKKNMLDASEKNPTTNYDKQHIKCSSRTAYPISKLKCLIIRYILA